MRLGTAKGAAKREFQSQSDKYVCNVERDIVLRKRTDLKTTLAQYK